MAPLPLAQAVISGLPEQAGPLVFCAFVGLFGGGAAALTNAGRLRPALFQVLSGAAGGAFAGFMAGVLAMEWAPDKPLWAILAAGTGGFLGPYGTWEAAFRFLPQRVPPPPPQPPPPTGDPK